MEIKDTWLEIPLDAVLRYYADGFTNANGAEIIERKFFLDVTKNIVLFKIVTKE